MDKKSVDDRVMQWMVSGALGGVSAATIAALMRKVQHMRDITNHYSVDDTDENTIFVNVPKRKKEASGSGDGKGKVRRRVLGADAGPKATVDTGYSKEVVSGKQLRLTNGTFGIKCGQDADDKPGVVKKVDRALAELIGDPRKGKAPLLLRPFTGGGKEPEMADWKRIVFGTAALLGGGYGTYRLADRIHRNRRLKQLQRELDAAKQHYVTRLYGDEKLATDFSPSPGDIGIAFASLYMLSLMGGSAYLTKRWLGERESERGAVGLDIPKAPRIVFRTDPEDSTYKKAEGLEAITDEDADNIKAALGFYVDMLGERAVIDSEDFRSEAEKSGHTVEGLVKLAQQPGAVPDEVRELLKQRHIRKWFAGALPKLGGGPGLWQKLQGVPILGNFAHWLMDRKLGDPEYVARLKQMFDPRAVAETVSSGVGAAGSAVDNYIGGLVNRAGHSYRASEAAKAKAKPAAPAQTAPAPEVPAPAPFPAQQ